MQPLLAQEWSAESNTGTVKVRLRPKVKFHDGTPMDAQTVAAVLSDSMRSFMGPLFADIDHIQALDTNTVQIVFREPSPLLLEGLEAPLQKPGPPPAGTGPFMQGQNSNELRSNVDYYQGRPFIDRLVVTNYPNVRAAWAEMLRNHLDMLYEVGSDALNSLERSSTISTFTFTRHYQYLVALNSRAPALQSADVRRALNLGISREEVVKQALNNYGVISSGPLPPRHYLLPENAPGFAFSPNEAASVFRHHQFSSFTCLVSPDSLEERIALELKRQLSSVGVSLNIEEASREEIVKRAAKGDYEAIITEAISGPSLFRIYALWRTGGYVNWGQFGNSNIDSALDKARHAVSEGAYRTAVIGIQQAFQADPPAIFLAWSVRARAVSNRFVVPAEEGRDVLGTLRLWKPTGGSMQASRN